MNYLDRDYQKLLQDILEKGIDKTDRTGTGTKSIFGYQIRHNMKDGFPLLTTKKMYFKGIAVELLWFLRGDTNIKYLVDNGCHIWDGDCYKAYRKRMSLSVNNGYDIDRNIALQVPAVSRCRNLICGVIASIDLELIQKSTGRKLENPVWLDQFDLRQPRSVTISYLVESLLLYGVGYLRVNSVYQDDGRPSGFEWVANTRVTVTTDQYGDEVDYYSINGQRVPDSGVGSLVTFQSLLPGVLETGGRTIQAALDIQKAASVAAATPMATGFIKNSGADLPEAQIQGLLASWKAARASRSTAYLTSTLDYQTVGYSPKEMMYNEASQYLATEIARLMNVPAYYISADMNNSMTYVAA